MSFFCLLWVPFFLYFYKSHHGKEGGSISALLFGSLTAIIQFLLGDIVTPGGFGFSRWFYGFIDIVCLPVLIPLFLYAVVCIIRRSLGDFTVFTLFWLVPIGAFRALSWSAGSDPILLVAVPLLWTALAAGIPYFLHLIHEFYHPVLRISFILGILALPAGAAFSYWFFFSQETFMGFVFFFITQVPLVLSFVLK